MNEGDLTKQIRNLLDLTPKCWYQKNIGDVRQRRGLPDIVGFLRGQGFGIEIKLKKPDFNDALQGKHGERVFKQALELQAIRDAGGIGFFAHCVEDVVRELDLNWLFKIDNL